MKKALRGQRRASTRFEHFVFTICGFVSLVQSRAIIYSKLFLGADHTPWQRRRHVEQGACRGLPVSPNAKRTREGSGTLVLLKCTPKRMDNLYQASNTRELSWSCCDPIAAVAAVAAVRQYSRVFSVRQPSSDPPPPDI